MKYFNDILHLEQLEFIKDDAGNGIVTRSNYDLLVNRNKIKVTGSHGAKLIEYESLPRIYKSLVDAEYESYGGVYDYAALQPIIDLITPDPKAVIFFDTYKKPNGKPLDDELKLKYQRQASFMRMIDKLYADKKWLKKQLKKDLGWFWETIVTLKQAKKCGLNISVRKLKPKYDAWKNESYAGLISGKIGNSNRLKADGAIENLIMSLYIQNNKPYANVVHELYNKFMQGKVKLVDKASGEVFNPEDYMVDGEPVEISKTTVWNILNEKENKAAIDKILLSALEYNNRHRPYNSRTSPNYAFSKLSMDDRQMPFKLIDGINIMAYEIQDVASECIVGKAYTRSRTKDEGKNRELFKAAMNDMFLMIASNGFGMPSEIEVEHHISNTFIGTTNADGSVTPDLLTNDYLFQYVTFCNPANPQQKRIEHGFRKMKYTKEKDLKGFKGRFYAKLDNNRPSDDKDRYMYTYEKFIATYDALINEWNNELHSKQDKYAGLTRLQVLHQFQNPNLSKPHLPTLAKYIGLSRATSINRTECKAFNDVFVVPMSAGIHNGSIATAYAIPNNKGIINEVYLYENDEAFIGTAYRKGKYNEAKIERTDEDEAIRKEQAKHTASFDKKVKDRVAKLTKIAVVATQEYITENTTTDTTPTHTNNDSYCEPVLMDKNDVEYWKQKAINDF